MPLPGSTASSANCTAELEHFGRRFHVAAWDFLGTGESDRPPVWPNDWWERGAAQAAAVERLIANDLERVVHDRDPATRTDARGFRRAADDLLATERF